MRDEQRKSLWAGYRDNGGQTVYAPLVLRNMGEICEVMGVGHRTVRKWVEQGAPIAVEGENRRKRYSAEALSLQKWRMERLHQLR